MANAYAFDATLSPTAAALATDTGPTAGVTEWFSSYGAKDFALHVKCEAGTGAIVLEGANIIHNTTACTPKVILTVAAGATGDFYGETTTTFPYKYLRLRCSVYAAATIKATGTGAR